jgi:hypothetical protein
VVVPSKRIACYGGGAPIAPEAVASAGCDAGQSGRGRRVELELPRGIAAALLTQVLPFFDARIRPDRASFEEAVYAEVGTPAAA